MVNAEVVGVLAAPVVADTTLNYAVTLASLRARLTQVPSTPVSTQRCIN